MRTWAYVPMLALPTFSLCNPSVSRNWATKPETPMRSRKKRNAGDVGTTTCVPVRIILGGAYVSQASLGRAGGAHPKDAAMTDWSENDVKECSA
jgi:hypothetical protein